MILPLNSYIRNPPVNLSPKQVTAFNAIRYSLDICQIAYERLIDNLSVLTEKGRIEPDDFPRVFLDVWVIINNSQMFGKIVNKEFGYKKETIGLIEINKAKDFRDSNQHLEERISQALSTDDLPIYGYLSWYKSYPGSKKLIISTIYSGVFTNKKIVSAKISNIPQNELDDIIQNLEFSNVIRIRDKKGSWIFEEKSISISKVMFDLKEFITMLDGHVKLQLEAHNSEKIHQSDLIIQFDAIKP